MIESFIEQTNKADTKEEVYHLFQRALKNLGYDRVLYTYVTDQPKLNQKAEFGIVTSYPEEWVQYYNQSNFMNYDPIARETFSTTRAFTWESIYKKTELTKIQSKIMHEADDIGILSGIGVGIHEGLNEVTGIGFANSSKRETPNKDMLSILNFFAYQFHSAYSTRIKVKLNNFQIILSEREREILHWMSEGKSDTVIADLLFIQHTTVRFHIQNIFKKLAVNNKTMAVVKALKLDLIKPTFVQAPYQG